MATKYGTENCFGPVKKTVPEKPLRKDMSKEEYKAYNAIHDS